MKEVIVMGNGPSSKLYNGKIDYACNISGMVFEPEYLCSVDPWLQFDIIRKNWGGVCLFTDFDPLPIEIEPEMLLQAGGQIPVDYDFIIHNPEQRENAVGWYFYSTGATMNIYWQDKMTVTPDYWQPKRAYVCYVPPTMTIHNIVNIESKQDTQSTMVDGQLAPSGAYALHHAASNGAEVVHIYGFDSVAGDMNTDTRGEWSEQDDDAQKVHFLEWYKTIEAWYSDVEFIWHMHG